MAILLKTASVRVSSVQIIQVRLQNKGKSVWKSRYDGDVSSSSSGCLPASRSVAMAAISLWSVVRPSRRALEHEEAMVGVVVWTEERERRRMTRAMAGAVVYIAMVGGGGTDG